MPIQTWIGNCDSFVVSSVSACVSCRPACSAGSIDGSKHSADTRISLHPCCSLIGRHVSIYLVATQSRVVDWLALAVNHCLFLSLLFCWGFLLHVTDDCAHVLMFWFWYGGWEKDNRTAVCLRYISTTSSVLKCFIIRYFSNQKL